jgi:enoyl-[acyl-carrier-protein] reductase (NADH)
MSLTPEYVVMALNLANKSVVITGAARGLGKIALFLASDLSSHIIGQTIYADGGRMALNQLVPVKPEA